MKVSDYIQKLAKALSTDAEVASFQLFGNDGAVLKAGFLNDELGMIYQPVQKHSHAGVKYLVVLKDDRVSEGSYSPRDDDMQSVVQTIKRTAIKRAEITKIAEVPTDFKPIELGDPKLIDIIESKPDTIVESAKTFLASQQNNGLRSYEGGVELRVQERSLANSQDVFITSIETGCEYGVEYNAQVMGGKRDIAYFDAKAAMQTMEPVIGYANALQQPKAKIQDGEYTVLMIPGYGFSLLDTFLLGNLDGRKVETGTSRFKLDDFKQHKQIARADLSFNFDQTIPMHRDSVNFSSDAVVGQRFSVLQNGKLVEPVCGLESAQTLGLKPKALGSLSTAQIQAQTFDDFSKEHSKFILILAALGVHTQNSVLGNYSLPCPNALYYENGKLVGPVDCVITGDFFEKLMSPELGFVQVAGYERASTTFVSQVVFKN